MRIPISFDQPLGLLIDALPQKGTKRRILATLVESFIIEQESTFKASIRTASSSETLSFLHDVKELLCWKNTPDDPEALKITMSDSTLNDVLDSEEVVKALGALSSPLREGESRDAGFDKKIKGAVQRASRIEIIDGFAASNLMSGSLGTLWFLRKVLDNFQGVISIISSEPKDDRNAPAGVTAKRALVKRRLMNLLSECHSFSGEIRVTLLSERYVPHNRRLGLRFDSGQATVVLEKGLGIFDSDPFSESHELSNADYAEFKKIIASIAKSHDKFELVIRHSDACGRDECSE